MKDIKERIVEKFGFSGDEIAAILVSNPYLSYVIIKEDGYNYLFVCHTEHAEIGLIKICIKCGTYDEMFACAEMLCYSSSVEIFRYDVK